MCAESEHAVRDGTAHRRARAASEPASAQSL